MMKLQKLTDLIRVPSGKQNLVTPLLELLNDGHEKRNVRRVIQINPDLFLSPWTQATF